MTCTSLLSVCKYTVGSLTTGNVFSIKLEHANTVLIMYLSQRISYNLLTGQVLWSVPNLWKKIKTQAPEFKTIKTSEPLELVGMDLVGNLIYCSVPISPKSIWFYTCLRELGLTKYLKKALLCFVYFLQDLYQQLKKATSIFLLLLITIPNLLNSSQWKVKKPVV